MATCKMCKNDKVKLPKQKGLRYTYSDHSGKQWLGKVCPDCVPDYFRARRASPRKAIKQCARCNNNFAASRKNQMTCSLKCREQRRSQVEVKRQQECRKEQS